jgi:hypothetical protein
MDRYTVAASITLYARTPNPISQTSATMSNVLAQTWTKRLSSTKKEHYLLPCDVWCLIMQWSFSEWVDVLLHSYLPWIVRRRQRWQMSDRWRMPSSGMLGPLVLTRVTQRNIPQDGILHTHRRGTSNLTYLIVVIAAANMAIIQEDLEIIDGENLHPRRRQFHSHRREKLKFYNWIATTLGCVFRVELSQLQPAYKNRISCLSSSRLSSVWESCQDRWNFDHMNTSAFKSEPSISACVLRVFHVQTYWRAALVSPWSQTADSLFVFPGQLHVAWWRCLFRERSVCWRKVPTKGLENSSLSKRPHYLVSVPIMVNAQDWNDMDHQ